MHVPPFRITKRIPNMYVQIFARPSSPCLVTAQRSDSMNWCPRPLIEPQVLLHRDPPHRFY